MIRIKNKKFLLVMLLFLTTLFLGLLENINYSHALGEEKYIELPSYFELEEFSENQAIIENVTSIDIDLGSSRWNITHIKLNFTNIKLESQINSVEDNTQGTYRQIWYQNKNNKNLGLGVEFYLAFNTILYGVYIYGYKDLTTEQVNFSITSYDTIGNKPSSNIHTQLINISSAPGWYLQSFSDPLTLPAGKYYLVLFNPSYNDKSASYWWRYTNSPNNSSLHTSDYNDSWSTGVQGTPFLYKLVQYYNKTYNPQDIEMAVRINDKKHNITNGIEQESGIVNISENYSPGSEILHIPIENNISATLNFTLEYNIHLNNSFGIDGNLLIRENSVYHLWTMDFYLERTIGNYTVEFSYPNSWNILSVMKNDIPLEDGEDFINSTIENKIFIFNKTIPYEYISWKISAESPNVPLYFTGPNSEIIAGSESISGVSSPLIGNYTYVLYGGISEKNKTTLFYSGQPPIGLLSFPFIIPQSGPNGEWTAIIYWNNETDAGVESSTFTVSGGITIITGGNGGGGNGSTDITTGIDPFLLFIVLLTIGIISGASLTSYVVFKRHKSILDERRQKLRNKFMDILSLNYIMILDKKTGINVYEQFFAGKLIDATLISGFLEAIRNFGIELTGTYQQSQTIKLEYQNTKIVMSEFREFRIILILKDNVSDTFIKSINELSYEIENQYGPQLRDFKGKTDAFEGIKQSIEKLLNISFISPLQIFEQPDLKISPTEQSMINKAKSIMKQNNLNFFYTTFLTEDQYFDPKKIEAIFNLIEKKIFRPTNLPSQ